jgi:RHS repeat-associated protein
MSGWNPATSLWSPVSDIRFLYDGWNLLAELNGLAGNAVVRSYVWGIDLSGSAQGAGGVGGLLAIHQPSSIAHLPCYDGNGNILGLVNASSGTLDAQYEYGPFGEPLRVTGPAAAANPFGFSTKYQDAETGLLYYGYRWYQPSTGRFLSKDLIEERGGANLYCFVGNEPVGTFDYLGREPVVIPRIVISLDPQAPLLPTPVNVGISIPNGETQSQNNLFDNVARRGSSQWMNASTGQEMLAAMEKFTANNCCVKRLTFAGHGWNHTKDPTQGPIPRGPGIPGVTEDSAGFYEDGTTYDQGGATISDLRSRIDSGKVRFCKPCLIQIHSCRVSRTFIVSLAKTTGCRVVAGAASVFPSNRPNQRGKWESGPGVNWENTRFNPNAGYSGFEESDAGGPIQQKGSIYAPQ